MVGDPTKELFLAVVREWGGNVGTAYPIYSLTSGQAVTEPSSEFPEVGNVFLPWRGQLQTWDFVRVRPQHNNKSGTRPDDAKYICSQPPPIISLQPQELTIASLLPAPDFDPTVGGNVIRNVLQSVTPVFYIWARDRAFGPLLRGQVQRNEYGFPLEISWSPFANNVFYEFTHQELQDQSVYIHTYDRPQHFHAEFLGPDALSLLAGPVTSVKSHMVHDRLSGGQLAEWFLRLRGQVGDFPGSALEMLKAAVDRFSAEDDQIIRSRCQRLSGAFHALEELQTERAALASHYLDSEDGKRLIDRELAREVDRLGQKIKDEVAEKNREVIAKKDQLDKESRGLKEKYQSELEGLREERQRLTQENKQLEGSNRELTGAIQSGAEELSAVLQQQVPLLAAVMAVVRHGQGGDDRTAGSTKVGDQTTWQPVVALQPSKDLEEVRDEDTLVNRLADELGTDPLRFRRDFLANLYVALKCSALNLIMGPPGYGKSSVVEGLAAALGHKNNFLNVTVKRSWSDDRHLLGFYDLLNKRYDPGPTGVANFLSAAERDWDADGPGVFICLLDEFNLAAPEYYFSQLLQILPTSREESKPIRLFDPGFHGSASDQSSQVLRVCPNVSFWGTINYDETTERLSPRLLDRTGMIFLTPFDVEKTYIGDVPPPAVVAKTKPSPSKGVKAQQLFRSPFRRLAKQRPDESWKLLHPLLEFLKSTTDELGPGIDLSLRVMNGMLLYLANATGVLSPSQAVDFVFQQRVLPVLRGRGPKFSARVGELQVRLEQVDLRRSALHVKKALEFAGDGFSDVDFLAYF